MGAAARVAYVATYTREAPGGGGAATPTGAPPSQRTRENSKGGP